MPFEIPQEPEFQAQAEKEPLQKKEVAESHKQMKKEILDLEMKSPFQKYIDNDGIERLRSPEGEEFRVVEMKDAKDKQRIDKIYNFMLEEFGEDETETKVWIKKSIEQNLNWYHLVENEKGEIVSLSSVQHLELEPERGKEEAPRESMIYVCFILTKDNYRSKGLAPELYSEFYKKSLHEAEKKGQKIKGIMGEAVETVERFLNKFGRKRMYFKDKSGNMHEVPYFQPPVDIDDDGYAHSNKVPEHVMFKGVDGKQEFRADDVLRMVRAIYKEYIAGESNYNTKAGFERSWKIMNDLLVELQQSLEKSKDGKVFLMDAKEREALKKKIYREGKELHEVTKEEEDKE